MFDSSNYHGQDLLFKDATIRAVPVGEKTTYRDWLGPAYVEALEGMLSQQCSGAGRAWPGGGWAGYPFPEEEQVFRHMPFPCPASLLALHRQSLSEFMDALSGSRRSK